MSKFSLDSSEDKSLGIISPAKNRWKYKLRLLIHNIMVLRSIKHWSLKEICAVDLGSSL